MDINKSNKGRVTTKWWFCGIQCQLPNLTSFIKTAWQRDKATNMLTRCEGVKTETFAETSTTTLRQQLRTPPLQTSPKCHLNLCAYAYCFSTTSNVRWNSVTSTCPALFRIGHTHKIIRNVNVKANPSHLCSSGLWPVCWHFYHICITEIHAALVSHGWLFSLNK